MRADFVLDHYLRIKLYNRGMKVKSFMVKSRKEYTPLSARGINKLVFYDSDEEGSNRSGYDL